MPQQHVQAYLHFPGEVVVHSSRAPLIHEGKEGDTSGGICFLSATPLQANGVIEATLRNAEGHERLALKIRWCRRRSNCDGNFTSNVDGNVDGEKANGKSDNNLNSKTEAEAQFLIGACLMNDADASRARMLTQICHIDAYRRRQRKSGRELDADTAASEWISRHAHQVPVIN